MPLSCVPASAARSFFPCISRSWLFHPTFSGRGYFGDSPPNRYVIQEGMDDSETGHADAGHGALRAELSSILAVLAERDAQLNDLADQLSE